MLFFQQFQTKFLYWFFKFKTDHQTTSANFFDLRELFQLRHQILTYLGCIFNQILLTYYVQDSKRCAACQVITAESSAQLSVNRSEHRTDKYTGHWETVTDAFGYRDNICFDTIILMSEELTATAITALNFVQNQYRIMSCTSFTQSLHEFICRQLNTTHTLNTFDNHCANITFCQFVFHSFNIVQRKVSDMSAVINRSYDFGVISHFHGK